MSGTSTAPGPADVPLAVAAAPAPPPSARERRRGVVSGTIYNLIGQGAPLLVASFAIPALTRGLGPARFGLLTLAWALLGYFSVFDLGLGRALTQAVADRLAGGRDAARAAEVPGLVWTGLALMLALGVAGGLVAAALSPWAVRHALNVPPALQAETLAAFYVLALGIPVVIVSAALRGVLEAAQRFDLVNAVRVPQGIFSFAGPMIVLPLAHSLAALTATLLIGRLLATYAWYRLMLHELPALAADRRLDRAAVAPLLRFGSWLTVSNVVSPLMVSIDRFVVGAVASVAAVAYYTAPWEAVTKLWVVPLALSAALFPTFTAARGEGGARLRALYAGGVKATLLVLLPIVVLVVAFAHEGLGFWLGGEYAARSTVVLRWLAVGVLFNGLAQIPFALVQSSGRPDVTAKLHLVELPLYLALLWWLVGAYGIAGAAVAWTTRVTVDATALFAYGHRVAPVGRAAVLRALAILGSGAAAAALLVASGERPLVARLALAAVLLCGGLLVAWHAALSPAERAWVRGWTRGVWAVAGGRLSVARGGRG